jgi:hypothetical protein
MDAEPEDVETMARHTNQVVVTNLGFEAHVGNATITFPESTVSIGDYPPYPRTTRTVVLLRRERTVLKRFKAWCYSLRWKGEF